MAADNSNLKNALSGAFKEIAVVENIGEAGESESVVGFTMGEATVSSEDTTTEFQFDSSRWVQGFNEHEKISVEFPTSLAKDMPQLETLDIVDSNGDPKGRVEHDLRIHIYADEPANAGAPELTIEFYRCEINFNEMTAPQDGSEVTLQADCNGGYHVGSTAP